MIERGLNHFIIFRDRAGDWCAAPPYFVDLVEHPTGWGHAAEDAMIVLLRRPEFHDRALKGEWPLARAGEFVEVFEPDGAKMSVGYDLDTKLPLIVFGSDAIARQRRAAFKVISSDSAAGTHCAGEQSDRAFIP